MKARTKRNRKAIRPGRGFVAFVALVLMLTPYLVFSAAALAQTEPPPPGAGLPGMGGGSNLSQGAAQTDNTVPDQRYADAAGEVPLVQEIAEQNKDGVIQNVEDLLRGELGAYNETYLGLHQWFSDDWVSNLFSNIGQLIGKWLTEFIEGWVADTVQFLTAFLRIFVLNPNIAVNGLNQGLGQPGNGSDDISPYIRQAADVMYGIAVDLLLLLFILCIWKYWAEAAWRGGGNIMGSIGRLIFTAGLLLAWPTIYAFEIQITNEMIKAIYFNSADQVAMLDVAMAAAVKGGLVATAAGLAHVFAPVISQAAGGIIGAEVGGLVLGTVGEIVSFAGLIIFLVLGGILIAELIYLLVLKAIQTALLTAQYMFAPIFLVFFATPDTENVCSGYVRSFVEVSLWTFVWVGLLKILVIILYSDFNPWGKIVLAVGILQMMIQVPSFLARAQISPMSDFISAGLITGFALKGAAMLGGQMQKAFGAAWNWYESKERMMAPQKQDTVLNVPTQAANPELLNEMRAAAQGRPLPGRPDTGIPGPPSSRAANEMAHGLATPGLNVPGGQQRPETEEERRRREQQEEALRQQQATQQAAQFQAGQGTPGQGMAAPPVQTPRAVATPGTPGAGNLAAGALTGIAGAIGRTLSQAGVQRGVADPTTTNVPPGMQRLGLLGQGGGAHGVHAQAADLDAQPLSYTPSGVINPADKYNHAGYKFVQMKIAAVDARTYNGNSIGYSDDGTNKLVGDGKGNLRHMRARKGATPEEVAHLVAAGGFTELFKEDAEAFDAARVSAFEAGEDRPKGLFERAAAGMIGFQGGHFRDTATAKNRFMRSLFKQAALGSEAYVSGQKGNAYTEYLRTRFGDWTAKDDTWAVHILTDGASPESPWNPSYVPGTESLFAVGLPITEANRAASTNPYVMKLPMWQRKTAIPAVAQYVSEIAKSQYPGADPMVMAAAIGRLAPAVSNEEVEAAFAIQVESNGRDVNVGNVQSVARLVSEGAVTDATNGYHALRTVSSVIGGYQAIQRRRGGHTILNVDLGGGGGGGPAPPVTPNQVAGMVPGNLAGPQFGEHVVDVVFHPGGGQGQGGSVHHMAVQVPGGGTQQPGNPDVRVVGGTGGNTGSGQSGQHRVHVDVIGQGGGGQQPPNINPQDMARFIDPNPLGDPNRVAAAEHLILDMHAAGFRDDQMQEPRIVQVAHEIHMQQPQMLSTVAVATRVLGAPDLSTAAVHTIQAMIDAGWNPNQIQRPDVWTAQAILANNGGYPTPAEVRKLRLDERFIPRPGARVPPPIVGDPNQGA